jgi:hypothetical protein
VNFYSVYVLLPAPSSDWNENPSKIAAYCKLFSAGSISFRTVELYCNISVAYPGILFGGVQQIQLRTEDKESGDLGAVASYLGVLEAAVIWYKKFHFI